MSQNKQLNERLAVIYNSLSKIEELGEAIMYSWDVDENIKFVFLAWYKTKLQLIKEELDEITSIVVDG